MATIGEYDQLIFTQKFSSNDYLFLYTSDDNNFVGLINPTPQSSYTPEADIIEYYLVDNMVDDMLEAMEIENGNICDESTPADYIPHQNSCPRIF